MAPTKLGGSDKFDPRDKTNAETLQAQRNISLNGCFLFLYALVFCRLTGP